MTSRPGRFSNGAPRGSAKSSPNEPLLAARLLATIGYVYTELGLYPEARPTLDEAVALARRQGDRGKLDLAQALVRRGQVERYLNAPGKAESDDREALAILERAYGPNHINVEPALTELGLLLRTRDPEQALQFYRRGHDLLVAAHGEADGNAAVLLQNIGSIHARAGRFQDARDAYERALPLLRRHFGERDPHVGSVLGNLAYVYRSLGDYARAFETGAARSGDRHVRFRPRSSGRRHRLAEPGAHQRQARRPAAGAGTDRPRHRDLRANAFLPAIHFAFRPATSRRDF